MRPCRAVSAPTGCPRSAPGPRWARRTRPATSRWRRAIRRPRSPRTARCTSWRGTGRATSRCAAGAAARTGGPGSSLITRRASSLRIRWWWRGSTRWSIRRAGSMWRLRSPRRCCTGCRPAPGELPKLSPPTGLTPSGSAVSLVADGKGGVSAVYRQAGTAQVAIASPDGSGRPWKVARRAPVGGYGRVAAARLGGNGGASGPGGPGRPGAGWCRPRDESAAPDAWESAGRAVRGHTGCGAGCVGPGRARGARHGRPVVRVPPDQAGRPVRRVGGGGDGERGQPRLADAGTGAYPLDRAHTARGRTPVGVRPLRVALGRRYFTGIFGAPPPRARRGPGCRGTRIRRDST